MNALIHPTPDLYSSAIYQVILTVLYWIFSSNTWNYLRNAIGSKMKFDNPSYSNQGRNLQSHGTVIYTLHTFRMYFSQICRGIDVFSPYPEPFSPSYEFQFQVQWSYQAYMIVIQNKETSQLFLCRCVWKSMRTLVEPYTLFCMLSLCYICYLNICHCTVNISKIAIRQ